MSKRKFGWVNITEKIKGKLGIEGKFFTDKIHIRCWIQRINDIDGIDNRGFNLDSADDSRFFEKIALKIVKSGFNTLLEYLNILYFLLDDET